MVCHGLVMVWWWFVMVYEINDGLWWFGDGLVVVYDGLGQLTGFSNYGGPAFLINPKSFYVPQTIFSYTYVLPSGSIGLRREWPGVDNSVLGLRFCCISSVSPGIIINPSSISLQIYAIHMKPNYIRHKIWGLRIRFGFAGAGWGRLELPGAAWGMLGLAGAGWGWQQNLKPQN